LRLALSCRFQSPARGIPKLPEADRDEDHDDTRSNRLLTEVPKLLKTRRTLHDRCWPALEIASRTLIDLKYRLLMLSNTELEAVGQTAAGPCYFVGGERFDSRQSDASPAASLSAAPFETASSFCANEEVTRTISR
jgi:hypothetical protein